MFTGQWPSCHAGDSPDPSATHRRSLFYPQSELYDDYFICDYALDGHLFYICNQLIDLHSTSATPELLNITVSGQSQLDGIYFEYWPYAEAIALDTYLYPDQLYNVTISVTREDAQTVKIQPHALQLDDVAEKTALLESLLIRLAWSAPDGVLEAVELPHEGASGSPSQLFPLRMSILKVMAPSALAMDAIMVQVVEYLSTPFLWLCRYVIGPFLIALEFGSPVWLIWWLAVGKPTFEEALALLFGRLHWGRLDRFIHVLRARRVNEPRIDYLEVYRHWVEAKHEIVTPVSLDASEGGEDVEKGKA